MSESGEEVAFASADEGEDSDNETESQSSRGTKGKKEESDVGEMASRDSQVIESTSPPNKKDVKKMKNTQQQLHQSKMKNTQQQLHQSKMKNTQQQLHQSKMKETQQQLHQSKTSRTKPSQVSLAPLESVDPKVKQNKNVSDLKPDSQEKSSETTVEATASCVLPSKRDTGNTGESNKVPASAPSDESAPVTIKAHPHKHQLEIKSFQDFEDDEERTFSAAGGRKLQSEVSGPEGQDIPREQQEVLKKLSDSMTEDSAQGWGWRTWGSSLLSVATNSVQTFTHQVGDGFSTIMETVESSLGVPQPEEIVKAQSLTESVSVSEDQLHVTSQTNESNQDRSSELSQTNLDGLGTSEDGKEEKIMMNKQDEKKVVNTESWFLSWGVADLAKKVQDTGKSLASKGQSLMSDSFDAMENLAADGIDMLESIGKKTYNTLSVHDPAFRKTREFLNPKGNKPNLSSILREARDKTEQEAQQVKENEEARKAHFGTLFDDYQGLAHLEALEMLSSQSEKKVHSLLGALATSDLAAVKPTLISIKEAFQVDQEDGDSPKEQDFSKLVSQYLSELELGTAPDKLNKVHEMVKQWIVDFDSHDSRETDSVKEVHQKSIQALAELTAKGVEQFHKAGELVLLERDKDKDCTERAHSLARLTGVLCHEIGNLAGKFAEILNRMAGDADQGDEITPLVTNVYLEATNSSTYIQDAFQLLLPVLQHAALEHSIMSRQS